jgi:ABC-type multidrug transport system fused ATPase/permease subunit
MKKVKKLYYLLSNNERSKLILLLLGILLMAFVDMLGIASILPFMAVLSNTSLIETNIIFKSSYMFLANYGVTNENQFLMVLGFFVFFLLLISISLRTLTLYFQTRFILMCEHNMANRIVKNYLYQPYVWFLNRNSASLGKSVLSEVSNVVGRGLNSVINFITNIILTFAIFALLFYVNPILSSIVLSVMFIFYALIYVTIKNLYSKIGNELFSSNEIRYKILAEAFGAYKEVKIGSLEQTYLDQFFKPSKNIAVNSSLISILNEIPRMTVEVIAFGGLLLITLYYMAVDSNVNSIIPIVSLYAFAGYRLLPALQKLFVSLTGMRIVSPAINSIYDDIKSFKPNIIEKNIEYLPLKKNISLKNINYNYPNTSRLVLKDINLKIPANKTVGFVGATGSGKTTVVDIIIGLLEAQRGTLLVDDIEINGTNRKNWQKSIGYVPQQIFLADSSISSNIAFGVSDKKINQKFVEEAAKIANIHDFIMNELPLKYESIIGERGVKLSGGQRQRIGIARALYHKPQILVFDEATSALDNITEKSVMKAIFDLKNNITKILIAHRLSTVKNCDMIFLFEKGQLKKQGTFEELVLKSDEFRESVKVT